MIAVAQTVGRVGRGALRKQLSSAIMIFCLQQRGSNQCQLALVWGVERQISLACPSRLREKLCRRRPRHPKSIASNILDAAPKAEP